VIFSSPEFIFYFLPIFLMAYFLMPYKNLTLLLFSILFYYWGEGGYVFLMIFSGLLNWLFGILIDRYRSQSLAAKNLLIVGILINLLALFFYKYLSFFASTLALISPKIIFPIPQILLPIGISFYTFHAVSYLVDVYRNDCRIERNALNFLTYIAMFPQLVAGPIVRFSTVQKELNRKVLSLENFSIGVKFFIIGLCQKVLIANIVANPVDEIYKIPEEGLTASLAWLASIGYSLQIYFDFVGYSNMAIGLGLMIGIILPLNFDYPYTSKSITEFWRRWHITLSSWFRDYVYIPLGGNRKGSIRTYLNLLIVFLLCGLWHGASLTFIVWGLYHGTFLIIEKHLKINNIPENIKPYLGSIYALIIVMIGWVLFRADNFHHAYIILKSLVGQGKGDGIQFNIWLYLHIDVFFALVAGVLCSMPWFSRFLTKVIFKNKEIFLGEKYFLPTIFSLPIILMMFAIFILSLAAIASNDYNPFIYFRF
jgi:alginate O-acetyltransferase complex protein AlgI